MDLAVMQAINKMVVAIYTPAPSKLPLTNIMAAVESGGQETITGGC